MQLSASAGRYLISKRWPEVAAVALYVALRVWSFVGVAGHASSFPDTFDYEQTASKPILSMDFWTWFKP